MKIEKEEHSVHSELLKNLLWIYFGNVVLLVGQPVKRQGGYRSRKKYCWHFLRAGLVDLCDSPEHAFLASQWKPAQPVLLKSKCVIFVSNVFCLFVIFVFWLLKLVKFPATIVLLRIFSSVKFYLYLFNYLQLAKNYGFKNSYSCQHLLSLIIV